MREEVTPIQKKKLYSYITEILRGNEMTAREVAVVLKDKYHILNGMRQDVAPRLTEMELANAVCVVDHKIDTETKKRVSIYKLIDKTSNV